jgi:hypothetical protein
MRAASFCHQTVARTSAALREAAAAALQAAAASAGLFHAEQGGGGVAAMLGFVRGVLDFNSFYANHRGARQGRID